MSVCLHAWIGCRAAETRIRPSALREVSIEIPNVTWRDVGGLEGVKQRYTDATAVAALINSQNVAAPLDLTAHKRSSCCPQPPTTAHKISNCQQQIQLLLPTKDPTAAAHKRSNCPQRTQLLLHQSLIKMSMHQQFNFSCSKDPICCCCCCCCCCANCSHPLLLLLPPLLLLLRQVFTAIVCFSCFPFSCLSRVATCLCGRLLTCDVWCGMWDVSAAFVF